jgi:hypothetical protein
MKINRAIGLVIFLIAAKFIIGDIFTAFSDATVTSLETVEVAAVASQENLQNVND